MKIHLDIANGYRDTQIAKIKHENPSWSEQKAIEEFIDAIYGAYIRREIGNDFAVVDVTQRDFRIDFTYEDDANAFVRAVGGSVVED